MKRILYQGSPVKFTSPDVPENGLFLSEGIKYSNSYGEHTCEVEVELGEVFKTTELEIETGGDAPINAFKNGYDT